MAVASGGREGRFLAVVRNDRDNMSCKNFEEITVLDIVNILRVLATDVLVDKMVGKGAV